ncbi:MAG: response regulator [Cytophagaceae bacterium]|nr:response regulator [Cytophagaceae bacterium]
MKRLNCVLIVDDDRVSNYITENVLRSLAISSMINTVSDGQAALEYIKYQCGEDQDYACPDLIILDISMRMLDGIEFVKEYRKLHTSQSSIIVILSTLPLRQDQIKELKSLGVYDYFVKPISAEKIIGIMEEHFSAVK